jgi:DNA-binding NtrC family response regulator
MSLGAEKILVVDDEPSMCQFLAIMLRKEGYQVTTAHNGPEALEYVRSEDFNVVLTDVKMPGMDGIELLESIKQIDNTVPVVVMTAYASEKSAIDAKAKGAFQYLEKHAKNDEIKLVIRNALNMKVIQSENVFLKRQLKKNHSNKEIIGSSEEMHRVFKMIEKVAETDSTILICGESGTGKELMARSSRSTAGRCPRTFSNRTCSAT